MNISSVSMLPLFSEIYERLIFYHLSRYANKILIKLLCGFRKAPSMQHAIFRLLQRWKKARSAHRFVMWLICHVHVSYDCIPHDLLIAKLKVCGLGKTSLHLLRDYLSNRKQLTKIGFGLFGLWDVVWGVPQGSIPFLCCSTLLQT